MDYNILTQLVKYMACIRPEEINRIVKESPEAVIDIIVMVIQALCTKLNLSRQNTEDCVKKVRTRDMGYIYSYGGACPFEGTAGSTWYF